MLLGSNFFMKWFQLITLRFGCALKKRRQDEKKKKRELEKSNNFLQHILK